MRDVYLSLVIPAFNEEKRISKTLKILDAYLKSQNYDYEIIIVDDGSIDETKKIVNDLNLDKLRIISNEKNLGKGAAVKSGVLNSSGAIVIFTDADMPVAKENFPIFIEAIKSGFEVAIASIDLPSGSMTENSPWYRKVLGKSARRLIRFLMGWDIRDSQRGFKVFDGAVAKEVFKKQTISGWGFDMEILAIAKSTNFKIKEIPVVCVNGEGSRVSLFSYLKTLIELLKIKKNIILGRYS